MITEKNKEQFEKWFVDLFDIAIEQFYFLPFEMQIGVYLAYYDSLDYSIDVFKTYVNKIMMICFEYEIMIKQKPLIDSKDFSIKSRNEAYKEAFKKANELINNN